MNKKTKYPWREVIFIGMKDNDWWLALSCGHIVTRRMIPLNAERLVVNTKPTTAPHKVRCMFCGELGQANSMSIDQAIATVRRIAPIQEPT